MLVKQMLEVKTVFNTFRYVSIVRSERLEISQPALDPHKSVEVHHQITARGRRSIVHRSVITLLSC